MLASLPPRGQAAMQMMATTSVRARRTAFRRREALKVSRQEAIKKSRDPTVRPVDLLNVASYKESALKITT